MESNGVLKTPITLRFCDTDMIGHINNVSFAAFAESGRVALIRRLGIQGSDVILVHLAIDYIAQVHLDDTCEIHTWVERLGRSSVTIHQHFKANGEVAAKIESVVVSFDYDKNASARLSDEFRETVRRTPLSTS